MILWNHHMRMEHVRLPDLVAKVSAGKVLVPPVEPWPLERRALLMDSMIQGLPIGAMTHLYHGNTVEIVDGAARLHAIMTALTTPELAWDLDEERVVPATRAHRFLLTTAWDSQATHEAERRQRDERTANKMRNVSTRLREAWIPTIRVTVDESEVDEVRRRMRGATGCLQDKEQSK